MDPDPKSPAMPPTPDRAGLDRRWQRRLGRVRLGAEPVEEQLDRYRGVTWALTVVATIIGATFLGLFLAFRRPDIGALFAGSILLPVVAWAWFADWRLHRRVGQYLRERDEVDRAGPGPD